MTVKRPRRDLQPQPRPVAELWAALDDGTLDDDVDLDEALERNFQDTVRDYFPDARLPRGLDVRLMGTTVTTGALDIEIGHQILSDISHEVGGAAKAMQVSTPKFDLVGLSRGSAVLHLAPRGGEEIGDGSLVDVDRVDGPMELITRLHTVAEAGGDMREFAEYADLLKALHGLVRTLDASDLSLEMRWQSGTGRRRLSSLGRNGRRYVRTLWDHQTESEERTLTGVVVELSMTAFSLKSSPKQTAKKYVIQVQGDGAMVRLQSRLPLGETVTVRVNEIRETNRLGIGPAPRYEYLRLEGDQQVLW